MMDLYAGKVTTANSRKESNQKKADDKKNQSQPQIDLKSKNIHKINPYEVKTFQEAVTEAHRNNVQLQIGRCDKNKADLALKKSKMSFLPSLEAHMEASRSKNEVENNLNDKISDNFSTGTTFDLTLRQNVFSGLRTINEIKSNDNRTKAEYYKLKNTVQELILNVMEAYADVCFHRECLKARLQKEVNLKNVWESQQSMLESGVGTPADVASAHANYEKAKFERIKETSDLTSSEARFLERTGRRLAEDADFPNLKIDLPKDLDTLLRLANANNAKILQYRFEEKVAEYNLKIAKGKFSPTCDLNIVRRKALSKPSPVDPNGYNKASTSNQASLNITVPIFSNSGGDYIDILTASEDLLKAKFSSEDAKTNAKKESIISWNEYISAEAMEISCRATLNSARLSSDSFREEGKYGTRSNTEILDEENKLLDSRINLAESKKTRLISGVKILYYIGKLDLRDMVRERKNQVLPRKNIAQRG